MDKIKSLIEGSIGLYGVWYCVRYYQGKVNFDGEKEERRRIRVEKYGCLLIVVTVFMGVCSIGLIINALVNW